VSELNVVQKLDLDPSVPESELFYQLQDLEKKIDVNLVRRRLEAQEILRVKPAKVKLFV
jgi:hypothetical protein